MSNKRASSKSKNGKSNKKSKEKDKDKKDKKEKKEKARESTKENNLKIKIKNSNSSKKKRESRKPKTPEANNTKNKRRKSKSPDPSNKTRKNSKKMKKRKSKMETNEMKSEGSPSNEEKDRSDGYGLYDYEFIDLLDRIRGSGGNPRIPQIILIGSRGCGKTSLLEIITGINLPKGRQNPTICPLEFNIIRSLKQNDGDILCEMYINWRFNDDINKYFEDYKEKEADLFAKIEDISLLNHYISQAQNVILDRKNENYSISPNSIVVNVYANNVEDIRIVDMPGWINNSTVHVDKSDVKRAKFYNDITNVYVNNENNNNNIIAFMMNALHDMKECNLFETLIDTFDKKLLQTHECIGIITGLGLIKSEKQLNDASHVWIKDILSKGKYKKIINNFVCIHTFNDYDIENNISAIDLKQNELDILTNREPWSYLFDIRSKLGSDNMMYCLGQLIMISTNNELIQWKDKIDYRLKKLIVEFKKLPPTITSKDSTAAVSHIIGNFISEIDKHIKRENGYEKTINRIEYKFLTLRKDIMATRPRLATKGIDSDVINNIYTIKDLMKLTKITHSNGLNSSYKDIINGVRHFLVESVISTKWINPSQKCLSSIHSIIGILLDFLSQKHVHQFVHFQNSIRQQMAEIVGKLLGSAKKEIETMLFREKHSPIVDITTLKQKVAIYKMRLRNKTELFSSGNKQLNENITEILSQSWAYFDIASNRYCDNIVMVIQSTLIRSLYKELNNGLTQSFLTQNPDKLCEYLSLNGTQKKRKKQLMETFKSLTNNRKQINDMIYRNRSAKNINMNKSNTLSVSNGIHQSSLATGNNRVSTLNVNGTGISFDNINTLMNDIESNLNPLEQIQPLQDENIANSPNVDSPTHEMDYNNMYDEGYEQNGTNMKAMQTNISTGELDDTAMGNGNDNKLIPADFYSDYIAKKKQLDLVVPKLAQINAQLEAQKRELERSFKLLKIQQEKLQTDQKQLNEQQQDMTNQMDEVVKEYQDLEELREEFTQEKDDFLQQRDKVLSHIGTARSRLEAAAHRMIAEREKFEQERQLFEQRVSTSGMEIGNGSNDTMDTMISLPNINTIQQQQQQMFQKQLEAQRLLMKQMRDAMIDQKVTLDEEKRRFAQPDYLKDEWVKLDAEKEYIENTVKDIESTLQDIEDAQKDNGKERQELDNMRNELNETRSQLQEKENEMNKKEEYLNELDIKLQQQSKRLKEDTKVNTSMYRNKVKMLKTKNKLLSSKLKNVSSKNMPPPREREASELHHLSLNIGVETQKDLLQTFNSVDEDFYATDENNEHDYAYGSDEFDTDDSYDIDYYKHENENENDSDNKMDLDDLDVDANLNEEQSMDSIGPPNQLLPHSTEEVLHIPMGDTPEPPIHKYMRTTSNENSNNRRATPTPLKNKNNIVKSIVSTDISSFMESPMLSIGSKLELMDSQSSYDVMKQDKFQIQQQKRKSFHQNKAKTITISPTNKKKAAHESVKLQLLTDDMMQEFDTMIDEQTKISDDIQDKLHTAFKLLEIDFKSYMQKNVELDADEYENELQQFEDAMYAMEHELEIGQQEREELEKINEELNRMVFEMQESDRKKQKIIRKYQEQNKEQVLVKKYGNSHSSLHNTNHSNASHNSNHSNASSNTSNASSVEIQKLNKAVTEQPQSYRQYSHSANPNNPFGDDDSTDDSDWEVNSNDESDSINDDDNDRFELVATNPRELKQSLANIEKQLHLEHGLEALALDEDEIEKLKSSHYNKQETLDKLKSIEKELDEKERLMENKQNKKNKTKKSHMNPVGLPPTITEEGAQFDDEESLSDDDDSWNSHNDHDNLDTLISPELVADADAIANNIPPPITPQLTSQNTVEDLLQDCDLMSVGMNESEARKILQELMNLKSVMNTPTLNSNGYGMNVPKISTNVSSANSSNNSNMNSMGSITNTPSRNALQQFQHTFQSSTNINVGGFDEEEALKRAQDQVFQAEILKANQGKSTKDMNGNGHMNDNNFSDIFPTYSMTSKSEFSLRDTGMNSIGGSVISGIGNVKQHGDMLESMVSNQIELKLQQTQLEAAMTKMELLDELKFQVKVVNPLLGDKRNDDNDFGMARISTLINLDELAEELQK